jgi:hypothetical protein
MPGIDVEARAPAAGDERPGRTEIQPRPGDRGDRCGLGFVSEWHGLSTRACGPRRASARGVARCTPESDVEACAPPPAPGAATEPGSTSRRRRCETAGGVASNGLAAIFPPGPL